MIEADREYLDNPTLSRLCTMIAAELIYRWEQLTHESFLHEGSELKWFHPFSRETNNPDRHHKDDGKTVDRRHCQGCNRTQHDRDTCRMLDHADFVKSGLWDGSATEWAIRM